MTDETIANRLKGLAEARDLTHGRDKTILDFGDQWTRHRKKTGRYGSLEQFEDIVAPFLSRSDLRGRRCADIGSGTGRMVRMLVDAGAAHVTAIEPSRAYDVLVCNTSDVADKVTCLNLRGDELPPKDYDFVVSIGVIHMQEVYLRFDPSVRRLVILDQINPQWAKYYGRRRSKLWCATPVSLTARARSPLAQRG